MSGDQRIIRARHIALWTGLLPVLTTNICYVVAAGLDHVPLCLTYFSGCTSASSTGRSLPESMIFRAGIIPSALLTMFYWRLAAGWLRELGDSHSARISLLHVLGTIAAACLIVYTVALGMHGELYALQRRAGAVLFFGLTLICQLILVSRLRRLQLGGAPVPTRILNWKYRLCLAQVGIGLASLPLSLLLPTHRYLNNVVEWNFGLFMYGFFVVSYFAWRADGYHMRLRIGDGIDR